MRVGPPLVSPWEPPGGASYRAPFTLATKTKGGHLAALAVEFGLFLRRSGRGLDARLAARLRLQHPLHAGIVVTLRRRHDLRQLLAFDDQLDLVRVEHFAFEQGHRQAHERVAVLL